MESTVNDVLDFRKLEERTMVLYPAPEPLAAFVDGVCRQCRSFIREDVEVAYRVVPAGATACFDGRRVFQILMNGLR
jgi:signal transduction histidine kinase